MRHLSHSPPTNLPPPIVEYSILNADYPEPATVIYCIHNTNRRGIHGKESEDAGYES